MSPFYHAVSGFLAGFFSSFTLCPTELVKCRLQAMRESAALGASGGSGAATPLRYVRFRHFYFYLPKNYFFGQATTLATTHINTYYIVIVIPEQE